MVTAEARRAIAPPRSRAVLNENFVLLNNELPLSEPTNIAPPNLAVLFVNSESMTVALDARILTAPPRPKFSA